MDMKSRRKECRVVILMIEQWPFNEEMANLLLDQINLTERGLYSASVCCTAPNPDAIETVVRSFIEENKVDVFITIGRICSKITKEVLDEVGGHATIFVGVRDPIGEGLINSMEKPGFCLSGVVREASPILTVGRHFAPLYPLVKTVLIPYSFDNNYLLNQARELKRFFLTVGINSILLPVDPDSHSNMKLISEQINQVQGIIILEGCYSNGIQDALAFLCWEHCIVLCGSGPYAIDAGASCALGGSFKQIAEEAYKILKNLWEEQVSLGMIPIKVLPDNQEFAVNTDMLKRLDIADEVIEVMCAQPGVKRERIWTMPYKE